MTAIAQDQPPLLEMRGVSKTFVGLRVLKNVSLNVRSGEVHAPMGENGAGKSTLMKVLSGAYQAAPGGEIRIAGKPVIIDGPLAARRLGVSGVTFTPRTVGVLSMAERQLVEIARALHARSRILVMDEPTTSLSSRETEKLFQLIRSLRSEGLANTVGSLGNPFFVTIANGAEAKAKHFNPKVKILTSADYDLGKQFTEIDNFIAAGVDMILLNAADPNAIEPAVKRAQAAGIVVVAIDVAAKGADATVQTNNIQAGELACQYIVDKLGGKGEVIIENGPQVSAVIDRVNGCKAVFAKAPGIKILSDDQDAKGSREGGLNVTQGYLTRFPKNRCHVHHQ